jgi:hypothetical protein
MLDMFYIFYVSIAEASKHEVLVCLAFFFILRVTNSKISAQYFAYVKHLIIK